MKTTIKDKIEGIEKLTEEDFNTLISVMKSLRRTLLDIPYAYRRLSEWNEDYLQSAYILIFDTTLPKGEPSGKRLLYLACMVFPELRPQQQDAVFQTSSDTENIPWIGRLLQTSISKWS
jgi:hypothetical protein